MKNKNIKIHICCKWTCSNKDFFVAIEIYFYFYFFTEKIMLKHILMLSKDDLPYINPGTRMKCLKFKWNANETRIVNFFLTITLELTSILNWRVAYLFPNKTAKSLENISGYLNIFWLLYFVLTFKKVLVWFCCTF